MGTREFTDEAERTRRRELVRRVGDAAFGRRIGRESDEPGHKGTWHADLARAIAQATGREIGRARVAQWLLTGDDAKPVPGWVVAALPSIVAAATAELRARADELDALAAEVGDPSAPGGGPDAAGDPLGESGPAAAQAGAINDDEIVFDAAPSSLGDDGEFDVSRFVDNFVQTYAHVRLPR